MIRRYNTVLRLIMLILSAHFLGSCNMLTRLSEMKNGPEVSAISNPINRPKYRPVSMPMPMPRNVIRKANSLWRPGARAFFRDQRASEVGDILTVKLSIEDSAALANKTTGARNDTEDGDVTNLLGLENEFTKVLPQGLAAATALSLGTKRATEGSGAIDRSEKLAITIAAVVTQVLPNGNLVIFARQELKVNFELREVLVTGVIRPEDINSANEIWHSKIAEMRVAYGGRGTMSDLQQPRYGTRMVDIIFPF